MTTMAATTQKHPFTVASLWRGCRLLTSHPLSTVSLKEAMKGLSSTALTGKQMTGKSRLV